MASADWGRCYCDQVPGGCRQGRDCPLADTEASNVIPLHPERPFPAPKGKKPMNDYRLRSGAWTGFAPRTTEERWPTPPRTVSGVGWFRRLLTGLFGR